MAIDSVVCTVDFGVVSPLVLAKMLKGLWQMQRDLEFSRAYDKETERKKRDFVGGEEEGM